MTPIPKEVKETVSSGTSINSSKGGASGASSIANGGGNKLGADTGVLKYTPLDEIAPGVARLTETFHKTQKTHSIQFRLNQLRNLYFGIQDNVDAICDALYKDFHRVPSETKNLEIAHTLSELVHVMASLHKWTQPEAVTDLPTSMKTTPIYVEKIPLGTILIIAPFNYPMTLSISPIVGAIAAGNVVVYKPTELTPHFSKLICEILNKSLDKDIIYTINGGIPETTRALEQKYDKIMYTGNNMVGKIVAKKAAETLTPVILELGGKSPCFVLDDVKDKDLRVMAKRIVWGRFTNCGQTCVAVDYVLAHKSVKDKLVKEMVKVIEEVFFANIDKDDENYTHIIHQRAYDNLKKRLSDTNGNIVVGAKTDDASRFISPTIIDNVNWDDTTMASEIFGPILPVLTYTDLDDAVRNVVKHHDTPLAQYVFTSGSTSRKSNPQIDTITTGIRSGATLINDVLMHVSLSNAPFGGVGQSGMGAYHGLYSFKQFTHERTTMEQKLITEIALNARYPPFTDKKDALIGSSLTKHNGNVWFGRTGNVKVNGPNPIWSVWNGIAGLCSLTYKLVNSL